jgi:zeaxanthin glucosyltransferase
MATILICAYQETSAINATRKLVRDLRKRGHLVYYTGIAECAPYMEGETFVPVFTNLVPYLDIDATNSTAGWVESSWAERMQFLRARWKCARRLVNELVNNNFDGFDKLVFTIKPDIMLIGVTSFYASLWGLLARRFHIPVVLLNEFLTNNEESGLPPITSYSPPSNNVLGGIRTTILWRMVAIRQQWRSLYLKVLTGWDVVTLISELARGFNVSTELLCAHEKAYVHVKAPEVVLYPMTFDFPHASKPGRYYTAASVDLERSEGPFPFDRLNPDLPIIFCSLGTNQFAQASEYRHFFDCVIRAFQSLSANYQLVLATGGHCRADEFADRCLNVVVVERAPQIALLKRAVLMITHAGPSSVRECMTLGVPMLLYPLGFDQFGHAARAVYHGVGLKGDFSRPTPSSIRQKLEELLTNPNYRLQARRRQHEFLEAEKASSAAECIETFLPVKTAVNAADAVRPRHKPSSIAAPAIVHTDVERIRGPR